MSCYPCSNKFKAHFFKILLSVFLFHGKTALLKSKLSTAGPSTLIVMRLSSVLSSIRFLWAVLIKFWALNPLSTSAVCSGRVRASCTNFSKFGKVSGWNLKIQLHSMDNLPVGYCCSLTTSFNKDHSILVFIGSTTVGITLPLTTFALSDP